MKVLAEIKDEKGVHIPFGSVVSIDGTEKNQDLSLTIMGLFTSLVCLIKGL
ncbi:hypothetical protein [Escherichia coli]|uniref:hypothetical protein n=1 Tax=Escherichia coli TaxID=562 RepID=UPI00388D32EB